MSPTSEIMAEVSLAHSCPELFRVTGPLPSLVLRTEDMWQKRMWRKAQMPVRANEEPPGLKKA